MNIMRYYLMKNLIYLLVSSLLIMAGCTGHQKQNVVDRVPIVEKMDSSYIFDGLSLDGWEITNFGPQGPVQVSGEKIILGMGDGCTGINWKGEFPRNNYKVSLEAKRVSGNDFFAGITFPVGDDYCSFIVGGWGGTVVGLSSINKVDASENETSSSRKFEKDVWYKICLIVKTDTIKALIDDEVVVDFAIGNKKLSIRPEVFLSKPFGISSWNTTAALRNVRLVRIE
jgi:3-keto-disaccharide hydrolase